MPGRPASILLVALAVIFVASACSRGPYAGSDKIPDDEAKQRGLEPGSFRYPISEKSNYLKGMDVIAAPAGSTAENATDQLDHAIVYQLLDQLEKKGATTATPPAAADAQPAAVQPVTPEALPFSLPKTTLIDPVFTPNEILGRNTWMLWCGGNEGFWDWLANNDYGFNDLLKVIDSRNRPTRFETAGLINEPGMRQAAKPDANGVWVDVPAEPPKYKVPEQIYGKSSGVVGLRLFENPKFADAKKKWDPKRYYDDPSYYSDPELVRPYRVGMSCAFCHASFHPLNPPANVAEPRWENISGNIGAQYLRIRAVFGNLLKPDSFVYHLLDSEPPGTVDTSLIASDNINNPNTMNAIFGVPGRVVRSFVNPAERVYGASATQPAVWGNPKEMLPADAKSASVWQINPHTHALDYMDLGADKVPAKYWTTFENAGLLPALKDSNAVTRPVPRILLDGADSIGPWGALARVYLNIGTFYEQWIRLQKPLIGFQPQKPFRIEDCREHSIYWQATQERVAPLRDYFLKITPPMPLLAAKGAGEKAGAVDFSELPQSAKAKRINTKLLPKGRLAFARNCIVCHSSEQPAARQAELAEWAARGEPWDHDPGRWLRDDEYMKWAEAAVETEEFWRGNYLSTDYRVPITLLRTNASRAMATNGIRGHMWEDFTSGSYQQMPSVGSIRYFDPYLGPEGGDATFTPRHQVAKGAPTGGGGVGFYRVPSLISIWATAPLLHNNSLGIFNNDPSIDGRLAAFDDAMRKLLLLTPRTSGSSYNEATPERLRRDHGLIWRTTETTFLSLPGEQVPAIIAKFPGLMKVRDQFQWTRHFRTFPWLPSAVLLALAFVCFVAAGRERSAEPSVILRRKYLARTLGYASVLAALAAGFLLYLFNGELGSVRLGPIPKGTPVNLLANLNPEADPKELKATLKLTLGTLAEIGSKHFSDDDAQKLMRERVAPALMKVNKCPDFVMDRGHYFEWFKTMSDGDKEALIELLKTF